MSTIECQPEVFFTVLGNQLSESFYGKKMSYSYSFEEGKDRKELNGGNLLKMCEGARWVKVVNVWLVDSMEEDEEDAEIGGDLCEEELRVERDVSPFADEDEDEDFDYHNTPPNSDDEGDEESFVRCKPGSGELKMHQVFDKNDKNPKSIFPPNVKRCRFVIYLTH
ncbi:uncharacterized protein LOC17881223 isoform X2 [Capsella rubella]|nr:uncharacterized protein LOC17881223 isoform X2 [Capsella rubella]